MGSFKYLSSGKYESKLIAQFFGIMFGIGLLIWILNYPVVKGSFIFWFGVVMMGIPLYIAIETTGEYGFFNNFCENSSSIVRIILGVLWGLFCFVSHSRSALEH
jgi:hypothetical protein